MYVFLYINNYVLYKYNYWYWDLGVLIGFFLRNSFLRVTSKA